MRCACCQAEMTEAEAMPAPEGAEIFYHADFAACVRVALANLATAQPWMRAMLGAEDGA